MALADRGVDVLLPTYRRPHTLGFAIRSVLQQSHSFFQLQVVVDGADPATESLVRSFDDSRIQVYPLPKARGFGYANRNVVLRQGSAPYVAYMTDDDLWFPDHLEQGLAALEEGGLGLVALRSAHVAFPDVLDPHFFALEWGSGALHRFLRDWFTGAVTLVHHRSVFEQVGYWNERLVRFGDREFYNRVRTSPVPSRYVDLVTVLRFYAQHWDGRYHLVPEPPQRRYLACLRDPAWCAWLRAQTAPAPRSLAVWRRQWSDFLRFGLRSGPKFIRFWYQKLSSGRTG